MERISHFDLPILNLPFVLFAQAFFIHVVYGLIERFLEETKVVLNLKKELWQAHLPKRISDVENFVCVTKHLLNTSKNQSCFYFGELECGVSYSEEQQGIVRKEITEQARQLKNQIHSNFYLFGMDVLDGKHVLNIVYCDLITITQHQLLNND
jgi:hypothetical protein